MIQEGLLEVLQEEVFNIFDAHSGGPLRPSEVRYQLSMQLDIEDTRRIMDSMVLKGELVRLFYNQYSFPSVYTMVRNSGMVDFLEKVLSKEDRSVLFFAAKEHKSYLRVHARNSMITVENNSGTSTFVMDNPAIRGVADGYIYPVCSLCTGPDLSTDTIALYNPDDNSPLMCDDCMKFCQRIPEITDTVLIRRILYLFRVYRLSLIKSEFPTQYMLYPTDGCIINYSLSQTIISMSW